MAIAVTSLVLFTSWGGGEYEWNSPVILSLIASTIVASVIFVFVESRAQEPIIPLHLFKDRNFNLTTIAGLIISIAMFGAIGYLPTYLQMVHNLDATASGFLLLPMVGGLLVTSILSGQLASRTSHYKWMPIVSMVVTAFAMFLMSGISPETTMLTIGIYVGIFGLGLGLGMQILVLIVQNSFPVSQVGTATASNNFFREIGATLGAAIVGSIFVSRLTTLLAERIPVLPDASGGSANTVDANALTPAVVRDLPDVLRDPIISSYNDAMVPIFSYMLPLLGIAFLLLLFVVEKPLETTLTYGEDVDSPVAASAAHAVVTGAAAVSGESALVGGDHKSQPASAGARGQDGVGRESRNE